MNPSVRYRPFGSGYVSEFEQFMDGFVAGHPELEQDRMRGWYLLWDRRVDLGELDKQRTDTVPEPPYHYE